MSMVIDREFPASEVDFILNGVAVNVAIGIHDQQDGLIQVEAETVRWRLFGSGISVSCTCTDGRLRIVVSDTRLGRSAGSGHSTGDIHVRNTGNAVATGGGSANTGVVIGSKFKGVNTGVVLDGTRNTGVTQEPSDDFTTVTGKKVLQLVMKPRVRIAVMGPSGFRYRIAP